MNFKNKAEWRVYMAEKYLNDALYYGTKPYDEVPVKHYNFYEAFEKEVRSLFGNESLENIPIRGINPLWLKVSSFMYGYPSSEKQSFYSTNQIEHVDKICEKIRALFDGREILLNFFMASTFSRLYKKAYFYPILLIHDPNIESNKTYFIDTHVRVYKSWNDFLSNNTLQPALNSIYVPKNGTYIYDIEKKAVLVEPSKSFSKLKAKNIFSISSKIAGAILTTASIPLFIAGMCTPLFPLGIAGITFQAISSVSDISDGVASLVDKSEHAQSIKPDKCKADYAKIILGSLSMTLSFGTICPIIKIASAVAPEAISATRITLNISYGVGIGVIAGATKIANLTQDTRLNNDEKMSKIITDFFEELSADLQDLVLKFCTLQSLFDQGKMTLIDFFNFNLFLLQAFNVTSWKLVVHLLNYRRDPFTNWDTNILISTNTLDITNVRGHNKNIEVVKETIENLMRKISEYSDMTVKENQLN